MKFLAFFAKRVTLGAVLLAVTAASVAALMLTLAFLYRPTALDVWLVAWQILLNGGNCVLLLVVLIAGVYLSTRRRSGRGVGIAWPASGAVLILGLSLISTIVAYAVLAFSNLEIALREGWLIMFNLTDITASSVVVALALLPYHIPHLALFPARINTVVTCIGQCVIIVCLIMTVIMLPAVAESANDAYGGPAYDYAATLIPVVWTNLAGLAGVIGLLNWRHPSFRLDIIGSVAAFMTFAAAVCYTLFRPELEPPVGGWYAVATTAVPLPLFLVLLLRRYRRRQR